jgi:hypothetical protein
VSQVVEAKTDIYLLNNSQGVLSYITFVIILNLEVLPNNVLALVRLLGRTNRFRPDQI